MDSPDPARLKRQNKKVGVGFLTPKQVQESLRKAQMLLKSQRWQEAISFYSAVLKLYPNQVEALTGCGIGFANLGNWHDAIEHLTRAIHLAPTHTPAYLYLAMVLQANRPGEAEVHYRKVLELEPNHRLAEIRLAHVLQQQGKSEEAEALYRQLLVASPESSDAYLSFGQLLLSQGRLEEAKSCLLQARVQHPNHLAIHLDLGVACANMRQWVEAEASFRLALALKPGQPDLYNNLANVLWEQRRLEEAAFYFEQAIVRQPSLAYSHLMLGKIRSDQDRATEAELCFRQAITAEPSMTEAHYQLSYCLMLEGRTQECILAAQQAIKLEPKYTSARWLMHLALPILYKSVEAIAYWHNHFNHGLEELAAQVVLDDLDHCQRALAAALSYTPFYLPYQGLDCTQPLSKYGQLLHKITAANYPQWSCDRPLVSPTAGQKIRIGYLSYFLYNHSSARLALGWLENHCQQEFEIYTYHVGATVDEFTERFRLCSAAYRHIPNNFEAACEQIIDDQLHILVFTDVGMVGHTMVMASLRLAPIQCCAWGHPLTSGLTTIDYFLSSEAMEPEDGQSHYIEQLIKLPKLGVYYERPVILPLSKSRTDFKLSEDSIVCLCCQSLYKYLPQYDEVLVEIAQQAPQARFIFINHLSQEQVDGFMQRLIGAFATAGLVATDYCLILPEMPQADFFQLYQLADIYLDSFYWSGGNTTLQALACGLPVVTWPGSFMRGRHSYGMLKILGLEELIATDPHQYVQIAIQLIKDQGWRIRIKEQILQRQQLLFEDLSCVAALEEFFRKIVHSKSSSSATLVPFASQDHVAH
jgi:protein O-GlcNAc transferase